LDILLGLTKLILELNRFVVLGFPLDVGLVLLCGARLILLLFLLIRALVVLQVFQGVLETGLLRSGPVAIPYLLVVSSARFHFVPHAKSFVYSFERSGGHLWCLELRLPGDLALRHVACLDMIVLVRF